MKNFYNKDYKFFIKKIHLKMISIMLQDLRLFHEMFTSILNLLIEKCLLILS